MMRTSVAALLVVAALAGYAGVRWYRLAHFDAWLGRVALGQTEENVLAQMGSPDEVNEGPDPRWFCPRTADRELLYGHSIPPEWWVVCLDADGRVTEESHLVSP